MKIICIGRNYAEHAKELNNAVPTEPVFFLKPETALLRNGDPFYYPDFSSNMHHELELVLHVSKMGKHIEEEFALSYIDKITLGIDFTARDLQDACKAKGLPWEKAKAFDGSAPVGKFISVEEAGNIGSHDFSLTINGKTVQQGNTSDMIFNAAQIISYVSKFVTLKTGDLIFTGTPSGVGPVHRGDVLECFWGGDPLLKFEIK